jgi:predicted amidohydrolase
VGAAGGGCTEDTASANRAWKEHGGRVFPARAYENGLYVAVVNESGPVDEKGFTYDGHPVCMVYDPQGHKISESEDDATGEVMVVTTLRAEASAARRSEGHYHPKSRRPELYGALAE